MDAWTFLYRNFPLRYFVRVSSCCVAFCATLVVELCHYNRPREITGLARSLSRLPAHSWLIISKLIGRLLSSTRRRAACFETWHNASVMNLRLREWMEKSRCNASSTAISRRFRTLRWTLDWRTSDRQTNDEIISRVIVNYILSWNFNTRFRYKNVSRGNLRSADRSILNPRVCIKPKLSNVRLSVCYLSARVSRKKCRCTIFHKTVPLLLFFFHFPPSIRFSEASYVHYRIIHIDEKSIAKSPAVRLSYISSRDEI